MDNEMRKIHPGSNGYHEKVVNGVQSEKIFHEMTSDGLRERIQELRKDVLEHISDRINDMVSEVLHKLEGVKPENKKELFDNSTMYCDKKKSTEEGILPNKQFLERNSILTDLFNVKHIKTIYNIFIVMLILMFINTAVHDIIDNGSLNVGLETIKRAFGKLSTTFYIWFLMKSTTLGIYVLFNSWAYHRLNLVPRSVALKLWDYGWLAGYIFYLISFIVVPTKTMLYEDLPFASSLIILMEQVRMLMKSYAFVRSAAPKFLSYKPHAETEKPNAPGFTQYLYFIFAPTLIYQDSYPRTKEIRWKVVIYNSVEVVMVVFYVAFLFEHFILPVFHQFGTHPDLLMGTKSLVLNTFGMVLPGILLFLCGFYLLLHSWMNASAELLRFADRMFYKDWWNSTSYGAYYRTWNVVVHDWLYTYIYKDMYEIVTPRNKLSSTFAVFAVSAIFHEYILAFAFRFFYPVMLIMFGGFGLILVFLTKRAGGNIFLWLTLCTGTGILVTLYSMEYYARINCPPFAEGISDLIIPRSWFCAEIAV